MSFTSRYQPSDVQETLDQIPVYVKREIVEYIDQILHTLFVVGIENLDEPLAKEIDGTTYYLEIIFDNVDQEYYLIIHYLTSYGLTYELEPLTLQQMMKLYQRNMPMGVAMLKQPKKDVLFL